MSGSAAGASGVSLDTLVDTLAPTFPHRDDAALALTLLRLLSAGEPVAEAALAAATGRLLPEVTERLAGWPNTERDPDGRIAGFAGLTLTPTRHKLRIEDRALYTWCAWDTLFLPELLDQEAQVCSRCPATGTPIQLRVSPRGILDITPATTVLSFVSSCDTSTIRETFCCHVRFFASADAGAEYAREHAGTFLMGIDEAAELARRINSRCFGRRRV